MQKSACTNAAGMARPFRFGRGLLISWQYYCRSLSWLRLLSALKLALPVKLVAGGKFNPEAPYGLESQFQLRYLSGR